MSKNKEIKSMLYGFMYGDGWLSLLKNNSYSIGFSGDRESLKVVKKDLINIYKEIGKAKINTRKTISEKYGIKGITSSFVANKKVAEDFISLGMPIGNKVEKETKLPKWIKNGSKKVKASFISGLYSAEGYTQAMQKNDKTPKTLGINITKRYSLKINFETFIKDISKILNDLSIEHSYRFINTVTVEKNIKAIITFNNSHKNIIKISEILNLKYCINKKEELEKMSLYLKEKEKTLNKLKIAYDEALKYNCSAREISEKFKITKTQIEKWRMRKTGIRIPNSFITYTEFKKTLSIQNSVNYGKALKC